MLRSAKGVEVDVHNTVSYRNRLKVARNDEEAEKLYMQSI